MLVALLLPIILSAIALFFASFLSWMILELHKNDWTKYPQESELENMLRTQNAAAGSYMFPYCHTQQEMKSAEFQKRYNEGPRGILTLLPKTNMGALLGSQFLYFLVVSFGLAYLGSVAFRPGAAFIDVFRFYFTAGLLAFLAGMVPQAIWFRARISGHILESLAFAAIVGGIFAGLWPSS